jgi:hypothetical protein
MVQRYAYGMVVQEAIDLQQMSLHLNRAATAMRSVPGRQSQHTPNGSNGTSNGMHQEGAKGEINAQQRPRRFFRR